MSERSVPFVLRLVNLLAGGLLVGGASLYVRAWFGMRSLQSYEADPNAELFAGMARFNHFWELSRLALGLVLAGLAVAALAALAAYFVRRARL